MILVLNEKFSDSFPDWLKKALSGQKSYGSNRAPENNRAMHITWDTAKYIKGTIPTSARAADMKDPNKLRVFKLIDTKWNGEEVIKVYIPGLLNPSIDNTKAVEMDAYYPAASQIPYKKLLNIIDEFGYILIDENTSKEIRQARADARKGSVDRDRKMGAHMGRNYNKELQWHGPSRGYDKSGYKLDPYKYINMLAKMDAGDTKSAARRIESLYNQIEAVRQAVVNELSKTSKEINASGKDKYHSRLEQLSNAVRYVSGAMEEYERLLGTLDEINKEKGKKMSDKEREAMKDWYSRDLVRVSKDCKDYIKYAKEYLNGTRD